MTTKIFVEFPGETHCESNDLLAVDCVHPDAYQLTHHLKYSMQRNTMNLLLRGDSSTDAVLNAILSEDEKFSACKYVTTNHFDIDSFLSVWCSLNVIRSVEFEIILREAAKIGDFRELNLISPQKMEKDTALRLVCWINSIESKLFYEPFESPISSATGERDAKAKFDYFLPLFEAVLLDAFNPKFLKEYWEEYSKVVSEYAKLHVPLTCTQSSFHRFKDIGLVVVHSPEPLHYYSLFSVSEGFDIVVSVYSNARYEVEIKYTSYVDIFSRGCLPRVEMKALASYFNKLETSRAIFASVSSECLDNDVSTQRIEWCCNSVTDSGPILRREDLLRKLTKAERYGHPFERQIYPSTISPAEFVSTVLSYFNFAYSGTSSSPPKSHSHSHGNSEALKTDKRVFVQPKIDWTWNEIHEFNRTIDWKMWGNIIRDGET